MPRDELLAEYALLDGIQPSLAELLRTYRNVGQGVCAVDPVMQVVMPVPSWAEYCWFERVEVNVPASDSDRVQFWIVPANERNLIEWLFAEQQSGDNQSRGFTMVFPAGYEQTTTNQMEFIQITTAANGRTWWPDPGGIQVVNQVQPGPILLEPGTILQMNPDGSGSAASVWNIFIRMTRTKIIRARPPQS